MGGFKVEGSVSQPKLLTTGVLTTLKSNMDYRLIRKLMFEYKDSSKIPLSRRTKVTKNEKKFQRPCGDCRYFRWLSAKFGVCTEHQQPSAPMDCVRYKRKLSKTV